VSGANGRPTTASITTVTTRTIRFETSNYADVLAWAMRDRITGTIRIDLREGGIGAVRLEEKQGDGPTEKNST